MKSLSDVADSYDAWAMHIETTLEGILFSIDTFDIDLRSNQCLRAARLADEAEAFRTRAAEIRENRTSQALPLVDLPPLDAEE